MAGVYFITAGGLSKNREKSLDKSLDRTGLLERMGQRELGLLADHFKDGESIYAWGAKKNASGLPKLQAGDYVVDFKGQEVVHVFRFAFYFETADTRLEEWIGWDEGPFKFVFFLRDRKRTSQTEKEFFGNALGYTSAHWLDGQRWYSDAKIEKAIKSTHYASLVEFLGIDEVDSDERNGQSSAPFRAQTSVKEPANQVGKKSPIQIDQQTVSIDDAPHLGPAIKQINLLQAQSNTLEREHEDAVAHFFEMLGYKRGSEIKFQRGRVDILIEPAAPEKSSKIVVEVKRDWALSRDNTKHIHQAQRYALENGARFVIVTNGDLYLVFDRQNGLHLNDQFLGEFRLTQLTEQGLSLVTSLHRDNFCSMAAAEETSTLDTVSVAKQNTADIDGRNFLTWFKRLFLKLFVPKR